MAEGLVFASKGAMPRKLTMTKSGLGAVLAVIGLLSFISDVSWLPVWNKLVVNIIASALMAVIGAGLALSDAASSAPAADATPVPKEEPKAPDAAFDSAVDGFFPSVQM